jgi:hypothetical protein
MTTDNLTPGPPLSVELEALRLRTKDHPPTLGELKRALKHRGTGVLLLLLATPFCFVAIPGLSIPFGIAICIIGICVLMGREPWLPRFVLVRRLSARHSEQLLTAAVKLTRKLEKLVRPRFGPLHSGRTMTRLIGLAVVLAGAALMLPLPIPFSNFIPASAVVLLAIGRMEQDGLCVLLGHLAVLSGWVFIVFTSTFAIGAIRSLLEPLLA